MHFHPVLHGERSDRHWQAASVVSFPTPTQYRRLPGDGWMNPGGLSSAGGSVVSALNGKIAVDLAGTQPFDLILMDMQMPVMDGYAATIELRRQGLKIPIIALTAYAMAEDRDKCIACGCDDYLSKPMRLRSWGSSVDIWENPFLIIALEKALMVS